MADQNIHEANLPPSSPSEYLATPSNDIFSHTRPKSASPASFRSSQSHVTVVEQRQDDPEVEKKPLRTQQTFKIQRKFGFWDWCKGLFDREGLMREIRDAIEVVYTDEADYTMFDHEESPFFKTVKVSPRTNSTQYIAARCLFDTGCYQGNIVSRSLVERLGYSEADLEPLSVREAAGGQTVTGEPVAVDAVIRLSWHHNTSPNTYQRMRFLVSSSTKCDMIVGVHSIWKHKLLSELIAGMATPHVQAADEKWKKLREKRDGHKSEVENYKIKFDNATTDVGKEKYERKLEEARHLHHVAGMRTDARKLELDEKTKAAADLTKKADDEEGEWVKQHPPRQAAASAATPAAASTARGASVRQSGPQLVVRSPTASSSTSGQSKKGSSSGASAQPQSTKGSSSSSGVSAQSQNTRGSSSAGKSHAQQKKP